MTSATRAPAGAGWTTYAAGATWASIFGLSFLVTKAALAAFRPFELLFLRFGLATLALIVLRLLGLVRLDYRGKPIRSLVLACAFQPLLYFLFETYGVRETASSTAGLILGALPAAVAALSMPMLGERLARRQALGLAGSVCGVALVALAQGPGGGADSSRGILLVVGALVSAAFYNIFSRKASASFKPVEVTFAMMASGALCFGLLALGQDLLEPSPSLLSRATPAAWGAVAYLGLASSVVAFFLVNLSLSRLKASQSSVFAALVTLVSLIAGALIGAEALGPAKVVGAAAILAGLWLTNAPASDKAPRGGARTEKGTAQP